MATNRTVTLKDGTTLTGEQAQVYGRTASDQPITADALAPVTPINVPPPPIDTSTTGTLEYFNQLATRNDADRVSRLEQQKEGAQNDWLSSMLNSTGELGATDQAYRQGGVDTAEAELKDIDTQILAESEALRKQIEEIQSGAGAATVSQRNAAVSEAQRVSLRKQADLAIIQLAKQGKYDSARAIADRAVASLMEQQKNKNLVLRQVYEDNKEEFDTQEQRQFEVMYKEKERQLANEEYRLRADFDQKIQQSDPLYQLKLERERREISLLGQPTAAETKATVAALKEAQAAIPVMQDKIAAIDVLKNHKGLAGVVGPNAFARSAPDFTSFTGVRQDFIGGVEKLISGLTLDNLIAAKERGATFGALSEGELGILANSASTINRWALKDKNGNVVGYNISETAFRKELDTIKQFTQEALTRSGQSLISEDESLLLDQLMGADTDPSSYF